MLVTSIITRLPPAIDGVGDYALNLALRLHKDFDIETHFVVGDPTWAGATQIDGFHISQVRVCSANTLLSLLPSDRAKRTGEADRFPPTTVMLHYVNYGYAKRGCPVWLVDGLQRWRSASVNRSVVSMFHEVYATGPPWASSFWLSPLQRNLAARVASLSDRCLTSTQSYAKLLHEISLGKQTQIPTLPVFSNIGEPEQVSPLAERDRRVVVFGSPSNRLRVYRGSLAELELTCQLLGIEEIWDVGPSTTLTLSTVNGVPVVELGERSAAEISGFLLKSLAGFFDYPCDYLAKSTIFAAYCAHGVLPVSSRRSLPVDGIEMGKHYWMPDGQTKDSKELVELQAIADHAHAWYQTHNLSVQSKTFATLIANNTASKLGIKSI
ncbi:MAG: glycosyltransferase family 1 protein [Nostoc sp. C3-bin3]|nr:glycosyltransferase family 1 protein [Nostoc sp. C3-bin3]